MAHRQEIEARQSALDQEIRSFKTDAAWLEQYIQEDAVTYTKGALKVTDRARYCPPFHAVLHLDFVHNA